MITHAAIYVAISEPTRRRIREYPANREAMSAILEPRLFDVLKVITTRHLQGVSQKHGFYYNSSIHSSFRLLHQCFRRQSRCHCHYGSGEHRALCSTEAVWQL